MGIEDRIQALEDESRATTDELKQILLDIRIYIMEAETPIPNDLEKDKLHTESQRLQELMEAEQGAEREGNKRGEPRLDSSRLRGQRESERG
ncbi:hypothetical protein ACFLWG_01555 [Chloroflexota bacterium]